jgi:3-oxoacid CoA-transferase B subunit
VTCEHRNPVAGLTRELIALRIVREFRDGMYVNLGFGLPALVANFIPQEKDIFLHSEQGFIGYGPTETDPARFDIDLIDASATPVTIRPGACFTDHATSFGIVRGGHLDIAVLGGLQVSERGDLANWTTGNTKTGSIGGGMDLAVGAKRVIVAMQHTTRSGEPRILKRCTYPLTAKEAVDTIVTDLAYIEVSKHGLILKELAPGITWQQVQEITEPNLILSPDLHPMEL